MPSPNFERILRAIQEEAQVHAFYKGHHRQMCPHTLGYKDGREKALFYQFAGGSSTGIHPAGGRYGDEDNWRCLFVTDLQELSVVPGPWHTAANHSRRQTCIQRVIAEYRPR